MGGWAWRLWSTKPVLVLVVFFRIGHRLWGVLCYSVPILVLECGRSCRQESDQHLGSVHVCWAVLERHHLLAQTCLPTCSPCGGKVGSRVWPSFHSRSGQCDSSILSHTAHRWKIWVQCAAGICSRNHLVHIGLFQQTLHGHALSPGMILTFYQLHLAHNLDNILLQDLISGWLLGLVLLVVLLPFVDRLDTFLLTHPASPGILASSAVTLMLIYPGSKYSSAKYASFHWQNIFC